MNGRLRDAWDVLRGRSYASPYAPTRRNGVIFIETMRPTGPSRIPPPEFLAMIIGEDGKPARWSDK